MISGLIEMDPKVLDGTLVFVGTRVPVKTLLEYWEAGLPVYEFLLDFPTVQRSQSKEFLQWLAQQDEAGLDAAYRYFGMDRPRRSSTPQKMAQLRKRKP